MGAENLTLKELNVQKNPSFTERARRVLGSRWFKGLAGLILLGEAFSVSRPFLAAAFGAGGVLLTSSAIKFPKKT